MRDTGKPSAKTEEKTHEEDDDDEKEEDDKRVGWLRQAGPLGAIPAQPRWVSKIENSNLISYVCDPWLCRWRK